MYFFFLFIHVRGSQKLIKLKKYNLQNRNYNRLSLQLRRYCVTYEFLISFENASNITSFFFFLYICSISAYCCLSARSPRHVRLVGIARPPLARSPRRSQETARRSENYRLSVIISHKFPNDFPENRPITFK